ncbi:hypothetical protein ACWCQ0_49250 [Streptomyces massasporeus]
MGLGVGGGERGDHGQSVVVDGGLGDGDLGLPGDDVDGADVDEITGKDTKGTVDEGNGYGAWNLSWEQWKKKSALA